MRISLLLIPVFMAVTGCSWFDNTSPEPRTLIRMGGNATVGSGLEEAPDRPDAAAMYAGTNGVGADIGVGPGASGAGGVSGQRLTTGPANNISPSDGGSSAERSLGRGSSATPGGLAAGSSLDASRTSLPGSGLTGSSALLTNSSSAVSSGLLSTNSFSPSSP